MAVRLDDVRGFLLDLNGVMYVGDELIAGAADTVRHLKARGIPCRYTTNTTTKSAETLHASLVAMGLPVEREEIISPVTTAADYLRKLGRPKCHLLLAEDAKKDFAEFPLSHANPDVIVIGDIGDRWNYQIMNQAFQMLKYGAELVALHKGKYWQEGGDLRMDIGAFVAGLEYVSGKEARVIGKPSPSFFQIAVEGLSAELSGADARELAMVGDDVESDVGGAQRAGLRGVLVKTGKYRPELVARSGVQPDATLDSIAELKDLV